MSAVCGLLTLSTIVVSSWFKCSPALCAPGIHDLLLYFLLFAACLMFFFYLYFASPLSFLFISSSVAVCRCCRGVEGRHGGRVGQEAVPLRRPPRGLLQGGQALRLRHIHVVRNLRGVFFRHVHVVRNPRGSFFGVCML